MMLLIKSSVSTQLVLQLLDSQSVSALLLLSAQFKQVLEQLDYTLDISKVLLLVLILLPLLHSAQLMSRLFLKSPLQELKQELHMLKETHLNLLMEVMLSSQ